MIDITPVVSAFILFVIACVTVFLIPYLKAKVGAETLATIRTWTDVAVKAAEQIFVGSQRGAEKKQYVIDFLNSKGYKLDLESIDNLIEAAVFKLPKD